MLQTVNAQELVRSGHIVITAAVTTQSSHRRRNMLAFPYGIVVPLAALGAQEPRGRCVRDALLGLR